MTLHTVADLADAPNSLAPHYSRFRVAERLLLTGHSHQAWPDVGFAAQRQAWRDAAELVDGKWSRAFERRDRVATGFARLLGDEDGDVALGANTHELVVRLLSALPLGERPVIVTSDGEFHTVRRQLDRLEETGQVEVRRVRAYPADGLAERMASAVDDRTACAIVSAVLFERGHIVPGLSAVAEACERVGAELLVDAYHALGAIPFTLPGEGLERAYVTGGGYKYLQMGEGNCFLRIPPECSLRPVITGWFSEFAELAESTDPGEVRYGTGAARFAGSTYDPTSHYRGAAVMDFFDDHGLSPGFLRDVGAHQVAELERGVRALDLDPATVRVDPVEPALRGGFLALECADAAGLQRRLAERGVLTDARGDVLRLGPAPYIHDGQLADAVEALGEVARG